MSSIYRQNQNGFSPRSPGLLPTPSSPIIKSSNMDNYIKSSCFPIPYQAVMVVESCSSIVDISSWDINVSTKSLKIKFEWSTGDGTRSMSKDPFPKAVIKAISSYNLSQPLRSTSYSNKKLLLRVEWKITATNDPNSDSKSYVYSPSPNPPSTPFQSPSNASNTEDSGYKSFDSNTRYNVNKSRLYSNSPMPNTNLFRSPSKYSNRHDVYRPKSSGPDNSQSPSKFQPKIFPKTAETPVETVNIPNKVDCVNNSQSQASACNQHIDSHASGSKVANNTPVVVEDPNDRPSATDLNSTNTDTSNDNSVNDNITPNKSESSKVTSTPFKYEILANSKDGDIRAALNPNCILWQDKFVDIPDDIHIDDNGLIDEKHDASLMGISGSCRRCNKVVASYESDDHLLYCSKIPRDEFDSFCLDQAKLYNTTDCDIEAVATGYCQLEIDFTDLNNIFPKVSQFERFLYVLELFLDNYASKVYKSLNIYGQYKRFNILNYKVT